MNQFSIVRKGVIETKRTVGYVVSIVVDRDGYHVVQNELLYKYGEEDKLLKWWAGYKEVECSAFGSDIYLGINPKGTYETLESIDIVEHCENGDKYEIKIKQEGWK